MGDPADGVRRLPGPVNRLHLMHVVDRLEVAGMEYGVIKVVNALDPARFQSSICCLRSASPSALGLLRPGITVHQLNRRPGRNYALVPKLAGLVQREGVHVVHSHNWATFVYTALAAAITSTPVRIHGEHGRETEQPSESRRRRLAERWLARSFDHVTAVSRHIAEHVVTSWGVQEGRVSYIPNGVDLGRFGVAPTGDIRREIGIESSTYLIGSIGRYRPVKDYPTLVRAFARVRQQVPDSALALVGADSDAPGARELMRLREELRLPEGSVLLLERRPDVPAFLSALDVYVNSSIYEGMSNTILEAMASRIPVVATSVGGNGDLVEDGVTGWLSPARDPDTLADRIVRLSENPARARAMGEAGRARIETRHGYQAMIGAYADLYESLLSEASKRGRLRRGGL